MSCCGTNPGYDELDEVSRLVATKLAAFLKTLRDNAFIVGLHEGRDAAALMGRSSICFRRGSPTGKSSMGCSTRSGSASGLNRDL